MEEREKTTLEGSTPESEELENSELSKLYEESLREIQEGEVINGKVIKIDQEMVTVDVGYKSEGQISVAEFRDESGELKIKVGDAVIVFLERVEDEEGQVILSKEKADKITVWDQISSVFDQDGVIEGKIVSKTKGGMSVDVGLKAFLPGSQIDLRPVRNLDRLIGQTHQFKVLKFNKRRGNIVVSRRALLEEEREKEKQQTLGQLEEGQVVEGVVKNITNYGAFIDLGGFDGLLHISDMSWGRLSHPSERFRVGDNVRVKVLKFDREKAKVALGYKQTIEDPWSLIEEKFPPETRVRGKVVSLTDYGAFVELEEGVEGLVHVSEMSWTKRVKHPSKVVSVGEIIEAVVLSIDAPNRRISLGMKQAEPNPWELIAERCPVGTKVVEKIKNITDFGIFIGMEEGIDGLIHVSDISWSKKIKNPLEMFKKGQEVEAVVLNVDKENERFSLGIKQLEKDPWSDVEKRYQPGMVIEGEVTNITDFGAFISPSFPGIRARSLARP
jgi:small subunit ribosomal protein S1